jgi:hypothetical protein
MPLPSPSGVVAQDGTVNYQTPGFMSYGTVATTLRTLYGRTTLHSCTCSHKLLPRLSVSTLTRPNRVEMSCVLSPLLQGASKPRACAATRSPRFVRVSCGPARASGAPACAAGHGTRAFSLATPHRSPHRNCCGLRCSGSACPAACLGGACDGGGAAPASDRHRCAQPLNAGV